MSQSYKGVVVFTFDFNADSDVAAEQFARSKVMSLMDEHALGDSFDLHDVSVEKTLESDVEEELERLNRELEE